MSKTPVKAAAKTAAKTKTTKTTTPAKATPKTAGKTKSDVLKLPKEKTIPEATKTSRANLSRLTKMRTERELKQGVIGTATNSNLGGQADTSGYSPYVLS